MSESRFSVKTPFTNIGGVESNYGGQNRTLKNWYDLKYFQGEKNALQKRRLDPDYEIYSQFTGKPTDIID